MAFQSKRTAAVDASLGNNGDAKGTEEVDRVSPVLVSVLEDGVAGGGGRKGSRRRRRKRRGATASAGGEQLRCPGASEKRRCTTVISQRTISNDLDRREASPQETTFGYPFNYRHYVPWPGNRLKARMVPQLLHAVDKAPDPAKKLRCLVLCFGGNGAIFNQPLPASYADDGIREGSNQVKHLIFQKLSTEQLLALFRPLVEEYPTISSFDGSSSLLHDALKFVRNPGADLNLIRLLATPEMLRAVNEQRETPLNLACAFCGDDVVQYLLDLGGNDREQLRLQCDRNILPLHAACDNPTLGSHTVRRIMEAYPEALSHRCGRGDTPVALALASSRWGSLVDHPRWTDICRDMLRMTPLSLRKVGSDSSIAQIVENCQKYRRLDQIQLLFDFWPDGQCFALAMASHNLDFLFLRLRESPALFPACRVAITKRKGD